MARPGTILSLALVPVAATMLGQGPALAQSFDCSKATVLDERAVCDSRALSALDTQMADLYDEARRCALMGTRGELVDSQRAFLETRAECGASTPCLRNAYNGRISELARIKAEVGQGAC